ncbi:calcium-binding protein, partial [Paracoccus sp. P2]
AGAGADTLMGGEGDDRLFGEAGNDRLFGHEGNDTLNGGGGNDTMTGGEGADVFVWNGGRDRITDFDSDDDRINLSHYARFDGFGDIRAAASQVGNDVVIRAGNDQLVIEDIRLGQLGGDDFIW